MTRLAHVAVIVALAFMVSACGGRTSLIGPSSIDGGTVQIQNVVLDVPSGTIVENGQQHNVMVSVWVSSVSLPDSEYISVLWCPSTNQETLTHGCTISSMTVASARRNNPLQIRGGVSSDRATITTDYIHVFVIRGMGPSTIDLRPGVSVNTLKNVLDYRMLSWEIIFSSR